MARSLQFQAIAKPVLMMLVGMVFVAISPPTLGADMAGPADVIDGDTVVIHDMEISLYGIDAPELKQTCKTRKGKNQHCGDLARQSLVGLVRGRKIICTDIKPDPDGHPAGLCFIGPISINEQMVADGWAMADRRTGDDFVRAETFAKNRQEGFWRTEFLAPWEWRKQK